LLKNEINNLAVIPARGGSKRIPKKNIKDFLGEPIISYSIKAAIKSKLFSEIIVSTDCEEIAFVAEKFGAKCPFIRSSKNSDDYAPLADVMDEIIDYYKESKFENICCILPTASLLTPDLLQEGYSLLLDKGFDSVRPVVRFNYPIQKAFSLCEGKVEFMYPDNAMLRTQDMQAAYHDSGQFYWMRFEKGLRGTNRGGFEIDEMYVQDIDNETDWKLAELKYKIIFDENN
jgi:pseudaminic acid cytidylyltransferase